MKHKFEVGDRVVCTQSVDGNTCIVGTHGTVVSLGPDSWTNKPGVEFDDNVNGHDCRSNARDRFGWYCPPEALIPEPKEESFTAPEIPFLIAR